MGKVESTGGRGSDAYYSVCVGGEQDGDTEGGKGGVKETESEKMLREERRRWRRKRSGAAGR